MLHSISVQEQAALIKFLFKQCRNGTVFGDAQDGFAQERGNRQLFEMGGCFDGIAWHDGIGRDQFFDRGILNAFDGLTG